MDVHVIVVSWATHKEQLEAIRKTVFGEEQGIAKELDLDGADPTATHVIGITAAGQPVACARLEPSGKIGRMAVLPDWRRRGLAERMLRELVQAAQEAGFTKVFLHAQQGAVELYRRFGFTASGAEFLEAGITHQLMELPLPIPFEAPTDLPELTPRQQPSTSEPEKAVLRHHHGESECVSGLRSVLAEPSRDLQIYSPYLDHLLFDDQQLVEAISRFARRGAPARVRVLIHTSDLVVSRGHRLLDLARRMDSKIEIRRLPDEMATDSHTYATWDRRGYWLMPDFREYDGLSNRYDPVQANRLSERFEYLWEKSHSDPELRTLRL